MARRKPRSYYYYSHRLIRKKNGTKQRVGWSFVKRRVNRAPNPGYRNLFRTYLVRPPLEAIVGKQRTSRPDALKLIWRYIKENKLQKPGDGRIILQDEKIRALTGLVAGEMHGMQLMTHIQKHFIPGTEENPEIQDVQATQENPDAQRVEEIPENPAVEEILLDPEIPDGQAVQEIPEVQAVEEIPEVQAVEEIPEIPEIPDDQAQ